MSAPLARSAPSAPLLIVRDVRMRRGGRVVLERATLAVEAGELVAVVGENGSGKSTLLQLAAGVLTPDAGSIHVLGRALTDVRARACALSGVGFAPDRPDFPPSMRVGEWLSLVASLRRAREPDAETLATYGLSSLERKPLATLSLGQARRVTLLAATLGTPRLLVLDEPTNGLDPEALAALVTRLRGHARAAGGALVATHDHAFAAALGARVEPIERLRAGLPATTPAHAAERYGA